MSIDPSRILIQLCILHNSRRISIKPLSQTKSQIATSFSEVYLDSELHKEIVVCNQCKKLLKFRSIDRSYSSLKNHRLRCQKDCIQLPSESLERLTVNNPNVMTTKTIVSNPNLMTTKTIVSNPNVMTTKTIVSNPTQINANPSVANQIAQMEE